MNGFEKRREQKKQQIINALTGLGMTRNLKEIGIREIAETAKVSPASIYNFFGSKEELAKEVFYKHMEVIGEEFQKLVDEAIPFKEKVDRLFVESLRNQEALNSEGLKNFIFEDPGFKKHIDEYMEKVVLPMFLKLIEQGKQEGEISVGLSSRTIMMFYGIMIQLLSSAEVRDSLDVDMRKEMTQLFMYGLFGKAY